MISTNLLNDKFGASLVNIKHGVNKSTFKDDKVFCPWVVNRPVLAATNPAQHIITTSSTASKVKNDMSK